VVEWSEARVCSSMGMSMVSSSLMCSESVVMRDLRVGM
jgi:hypothetical protein